MTTNETVERRTLTVEAVAVRAGKDGGGPVITGYASVFNSPSEILYEADYGKFREVVAPGAFRRTIREQDVVLLVEHAALPLGRTGAGTLELSEDAKGLRFRSVLDADDPDVKRLIPKVKRGDMARCSFGFIPIRETWDDSTTPPTRTLKEVRLVDVSIVSRPAYPATSVAVRSVGDDTQQPKSEMFDGVVAALAALATATGRDPCRLLTQVADAIARQRRGRAVEHATIAEHRETRG